MSRISSNEWSIKSGILNIENRNKSLNSSWKSSIKPNDVERIIFSIHFFDHWIERFSMNYHVKPNRSEVNLTKQRIEINLLETFRPNDRFGCVTSFGKQSTIDLLRCESRCGILWLSLLLFNCAHRWNRIETITVRTNEKSALWRHSLV